MILYDVNVVVEGLFELLFSLLPALSVLVDRPMHVHGVFVSDTIP